MVSLNFASRLGRQQKTSLAVIQDSSCSSCQQESFPQNKATMVARDKRLRFNLSKSSIHAHYCLDDLSDDEYYSMWITADEFAASKQEYVMVVRQMMKSIGPLPETDECCTRGLEFKTKEGAKRRKRIKKRACFAVLDEQDIQREEGVSDIDFLSEVYKEFSSQASLEALNRGLKDQRVMLELLEDNDRRHWEQKNGPNKKGSTALEPVARRRSIEVVVSTEEVQRTS